MKKRFIIVGSDNFWYTGHNGTLEEALKIAEGIPDEIENGQYDVTGIPETLYIYEVKKETKFHPENGVVSY